MIESVKWRGAVVIVVLLACVFLLLPTVIPPESLPKFWKNYLPSSPVRLGLDLQGGLHLILEVQTEKAAEATVDQALSESLDLMKDARIRYSDAVRTSETSFSVFLKNSDQEILFDSEVLPKLGSFQKKFSGQTDKGYEIKLALDPKVMEEAEKQAVRQAVDTIRNRVDALGVAEPDVVVHGEDRIIVQLPGLKEDVERAINIIQKTARLEFKIVDPDCDETAALRGDLPKGDQVLYQIQRDPSSQAIKRTPFCLKKTILMTGDVLTDARVRYDQYGRPYISMDFNRRGARTFEKITGDNVGERLAIVLDNVVYSAPVIRDRIPGGSAVIESGSVPFTPEEASELALVLRAGSLPAPVKILERRSVGPSLGEDSIRLGRNAILLGMCLIILGMVIYYKWSGAVADAALVLNLMLIFAIMVLPGLRATLTLPGLAGVALTMGMAIDANILIFERIREELRLGKSPKAALDSGYSKAFSTIFDANLTTIFAALPLIQFGTGPIKGFAVTLCIGLAVSMFTALFVTRVIFDWAFENMRIRQMSI